LSSGVFFWKWILLEIILLVVIFKSRELKELFCLRNFVVYLFMLFLAGGFYSSLGLAWFDSGYLTTYKYYLEDPEGEVYSLDSSFFAPYDTNFARGRFFFLTEDKVISSTFGTVVDKELYASLQTGNYATTFINSLKEEFGQQTYDSIKGVQFQNFLAEFALNKNNSSPKAHGFWNPPLHIYLGKSQIDFNMKTAGKLLVVKEEKQISRPKPGVDFLTDYKIYRTDTLSITLKR